MASRNRAGSFSHFFKVILKSTLEDKKLRIPDKFVRIFGDTLSDQVTLTVPNGRVWRVGLTKDGSKIWFHDGWHDFVQYHSIGVGFFLVFRYVKNSNFHVLIFDVTACEIQYPYNERGNELHNKRRRMEEPAGKNESNSIGTHFKLKKTAYKVGMHSPVDESELLALLEDMGIFVPRTFRNIAVEERERTAAAVKSFMPKYPSFMIILRSTNLRDHRVFVPANFAKNYLSSEYNFIKFLDSEGRELSAEAISYGIGNCYIKGLSGLFREKNLREGDICIFELIRMNEFMKISVFDGSKV